MKLTKEMCEKACLYLLNHCYEEDLSDDGEHYIFTPSGFRESDIFKQLIEEHFELVENFKQLEKNYDDLYDDKKENTISFKYFHLLTDSTLKSWGKEALFEYIHTLYHNWRNTDCDYNRTIDYANTLRDENEQLRKALDNAIKQCCFMVTGSDACNSLDELYKAFEMKVWKDVD